MLNRVPNKSRCQKATATTPNHCDLLWSRSGGKTQEIGFKLLEETAAKGRRGHLERSEQHHRLLGSQEGWSLGAMQPSTSFPCPPLSDSNHPWEYIKSALSRVRENVQHE